MNLRQWCQPIELILSDVDGVLTDGRIVVDNQGIETKQFCVRDGMGVRLWQRAGYRFGIITQRSSHVVKMRASELNVELVRQGRDDKLATIREILAEMELEPTQVCYIGDDLPDLRSIRYVGLGVAVANACEEVRQAARYVTPMPGGHGAVRHSVETILKAQDRWEEVIRPYMEGSE